MRYMLLIYGDETTESETTPEQWEAVIAAHNAFGAEASERGLNPTGEALHATNTANTVRFEGGQPTITTNGPFAETKEQLGGFYLLDCKDLDEALEMARKIPVRNGSVEIRPVVEFG
jgi:hypothetical protein